MQYWFPFQCIFKNGHAWYFSIYFSIFFIITRSHRKVTHYSENHNQAGVFRDLHDEDMIQMVYEKCILGWAKLADLVHQTTAFLLSILKHRPILSQHYDSQQDIYLIQAYADLPRETYNGRWHSRKGTSHAWGKTLYILWLTLPMFQLTKIYTLVTLSQLKDNWFSVRLILFYSRHCTYRRPRRTEWKCYFNLISTFITTTSQVVENRKKQKQTDRNSHTHSSLVMIMGLHG